MTPARAYIVISNDRGHLPDGVVEMYAEGGTASHAQCFTSLDGAWFAR